MDSPNKKTEAGEKIPSDSQLEGDFSECSRHSKHRIEDGNKADHLPGTAILSRDELKTSSPVDNTISNILLLPGSINNTCTHNSEGLDTLATVDINAGNWNFPPLKVRSLPMVSDAPHFCNPVFTSRDRFKLKVTSQPSRELSSTSVNQDKRMMKSCTENTSSYKHLILKDNMKVAEEDIKLLFLEYKLGEMNTDNPRKNEADVIISTNENRCTVNSTEGKCTISTIKKPTSTSKVIQPILSGLTQPATVSKNIFSVELMQEKQNKEYLKLPTDRQGINTLHETIEQLRVNLEMECDDVHQETNSRLLQESTYKEMKLQFLKNKLEVSEDRIRALIEAFEEQPIQKSLKFSGISEHKIQQEEKITQLEEFDTDTNKLKELVRKIKLNEEQLVIASQETGRLKVELDIFRERTVRAEEELYLTEDRVQREMEELKSRAIKAEEDLFCVLQRAETAEGLLHIADTGTELTTEVMKDEVIKINAQLILMLRMKLKRSESDVKLLTEEMKDMEDTDSLGQLEKTSVKLFDTELELIQTKKKLLAVEGELEVSNERFNNTEMILCQAEERAEKSEEDLCILKKKAEEAEQHHMKEMKMLKMKANHVEKKLSEFSEEMLCRARNRATKAESDLRISKQIEVELCGAKDRIEEVNQELREELSKTVLKEEQRAAKAEEEISTLKQQYETEIKKIEYKAENTEQLLLVSEKEANNLKADIQIFDEKNTITEHTAHKNLNRANKAEGDLAELKEKSDRERKRLQIKLEQSMKKAHEAELKADLANKNYKHASEELCRMERQLFERTETAKGAKKLLQEFEKRASAAEENLKTAEMNHTSRCAELQEKVNQLEKKEEQFQWKIENMDVRFKQAQSVTKSEVDRLSSTLDNETKERNEAERKIVSIQLNLKEITCKNEELKTNLAKKDAERLEAIELAKETEIDQREKVFTLQNINHQLTDQNMFLELEGQRKDIISSQLKHNLDLLQSSLEDHRKDEIPSKRKLSDPKQEKELLDEPHLHNEPATIVQQQAYLCMKAKPQELEDHPEMDGAEQRVIVATAAHDQLKKKRSKKILRDKKSTQLAVESLISRKCVRRNIQSRQLSPSYRKEPIISSTGSGENLCKITDEICKKIKKLDSQLQLQFHQSTAKIPTGQVEKKHSGIHIRTIQELYKGEVLSHRMLTEDMYRSEEKRINEEKIRWEQKRVQLRSNQLSIHNYDVTNLSSKSYNSVDIDVLRTCWDN